MLNVSGHSIDIHTITSRETHGDCRLWKVSFGDNNVNFLFYNHIYDTQNAVSCGVVNLKEDFYNSSFRLGILSHDLELVEHCVLFLCGGTEPFYSIPSMVGPHRPQFTCLIHSVCKFGTMRLGRRRCRTAVLEIRLIAVLLFCNLTGRSCGRIRSHSRRRRGGP